MRTDGRDLTDCLHCAFLPNTSFIPPARAGNDVFRALPPPSAAGHGKLACAWFKHLPSLEKRGTWHVDAEERLDGTGHTAASTILPFYEGYIKQTPRAERAGRVWRWHLFSHAGAHHLLRYMHTHTHPPTPATFYPRALRCASLYTLYFTRTRVAKPEGGSDCGKRCARAATDHLRSIDRHTGLPLVRRKTHRRRTTHLLRLPHTCLHTTSTRAFYPHTTTYPTPHTPSHPTRTPLAYHYSATCAASPPTTPHTTPHPRAGGRRGAGALAPPVIQARSSAAVHDGGPKTLWKTAHAGARLSATGAVQRLLRSTGQGDILPSTCLPF